MTTLFPTLEPSEAPKITALRTRLVQLEERFREAIQEADLPMLQTRYHQIVENLELLANMERMAIRG